MAITLLNTEHKNQVEIFYIIIQCMLSFFNIWPRAYHLTYK